MTKLRTFFAGAAIAATLFGSVAANAVSYTVNLTVGPGSVTGNIDTDGTLGVLATGNITDWNLLLNDGASTLLLDGTTNSQVLVAGDQFTATATGIFFNFSSNGPFAAVDFQNPTIGSSINYFCLNDAGGGCSSNPSAIGLRLSGASIGDPRQGVTLIGSVAGVPEPGSWTLMIAGFAATGLGVRRRRVQLAA